MTMVADDKMLRRLILGESPEEEVRALIRAKDKDPNRLKRYNAILGELVSWDEEILLRISEHLFIVRSPGGRIVKCDCGQEFGDYRVNWKLGCNIYVRDSRESMKEVFNADIGPSPKFFEVREYSCPGCATQLGVEVVPPGYPILFELLPDLDTLYGDWLGEPLEDAADDWYQDLTWTKTKEWLDDGR